MKGIYTLANDKDSVIDDTLAFLNSLFTYEQNYPVMIIPYNDDYHKIASIVGKQYDVKIYDNKALLKAIDNASHEIFGKTSHLVRKFACWFGPFDEFIYYDTDVVVLHEQREIFDLLTKYDFVSDGSIRQMGIKNVFTEKVYEKNIFPREKIKELFNAGFYASKKEVINHDQLMQIFKEAVDVADIFDMPNDQPLLNYMMLRDIPNRANLRVLDPASTDMWAGVKGLKVRGKKIYYKGDIPVRYVHWAGLKPIAMRPYVNLWLKYRYPGNNSIFKRLFLNIFYSFKQMKLEIKIKLRDILMEHFPRLFALIKGARKNN
jgi:hypothetical protein